MDFANKQPKRKKNKAIYALAASILLSTFLFCIVLTIQQDKRNYDVKKIQKTSVEKPLTRQPTTDTVVFDSIVVYTRNKAGQPLKLATIHRKAKDILIDKQYFSKSLVSIHQTYNAAEYFLVSWSKGRRLRKIERIVIPQKLRKKRELIREETI